MFYCVNFVMINLYTILLLVSLIYKIELVRIKRLYSKIIILAEIVIMFCSYLNYNGHENILGFVHCIHSLLICFKFNKHKIHRYIIYLLMIFFYLQGNYHYHYLLCTIPIICQISIFIINIFGPWIFSLIRDSINYFNRDI